MQKAIFWDFDGTLVKSNSSFLDALMKALKKSEVSISQPDCRRFLKSACSWNRPEEIYFDRTGELWWQDLLEKLQKFSTDFSAPVEKVPIICSHFRQNVISYPYEFYDDAVPAVSAAAELGFENYILSNNFPELGRIIRSSGLNPYIRDIILSSESGAEKPHKAIFEKAVIKAGNPSLSLMVGDNPIADIEGAKAAEMTAILVHKDIPCEKADFLSPSLMGILPFLKHLQCNRVGG